MLKVGLNFQFSCVCVLVWCMYLIECGNVVTRTEATAGPWVSSCVSLTALEQSLTEAEVCHLVSASLPGSSRGSPVSSPHRRSTHSYAWLFTRGLRIRTQVLPFAEQGFLLSHVLSPCTQCLNCSTEETTLETHSPDWMQTNVNISLSTYWTPQKEVSGLLDNCRKTYHSKMIQSIVVTSPT